MAGSSPELAAPVSLSREDVRRVLALAERVAAADGVDAFSEQTVLTLRRPGRSVRHLLLTDPGGVVGYGQVDEGSAELAVDPARRREGWGALLLDAVLAETGTRVWAHGDLPAARALARNRGLVVVRDLWLMTARPPAPAEDRREQDGVEVRTFRVGHDEQDWLHLNARAFAAHPEQARMSRADLDARMAEPWFDPEAFLLARDRSTGQLLGAMWLKIADGTGEIYVLGVDPGAQGRGIGALLTARAMDVFATRGVDTLELYVEGENTAAIALYRRAGFTKARADVQYAREPVRPTSPPDATMGA